MSTLDEQLKNDMKTAMRAKDKLRLDVIRGARAALQSAQQVADKERYDEAVREIEQRLGDNREQVDAALEQLEVEPQPLTDDEAQDVIRREVKRRRDAAEAYAKAGNTELQQQEEAEAAVLEEYLPRQLSADELRPQVQATITELGATGPADMGKVMPVLIERFKGQADGKLLSQLAREALA